MYNEYVLIGMSPVLTCLNPTFGPTICLRGNLPFTFMPGDKHLWPKLSDVLCRYIHVHAPCVCAYYVPYVKKIKRFQFAQNNDQSTFNYRWWEARYGLIGI